MKFSGCIYKKDSPSLKQNKTHNQTRIRRNGSFVFLNGVWRDDMYSRFYYLEVMRNRFEEPGCSKNHWRLQKTLPLNYIGNLTSLGTFPSPRFLHAFRNTKVTESDFFPLTLKFLNKPLLSYSLARYDSRIPLSLVSRDFWMAWLSGNNYAMIKDSVSNKRPIVDSVFVF